MSQSESVLLELYGKRAAVMVSSDQYKEMLEALEESHDVAAFDAAPAEVGDNIPWEQLKSDLGWSRAPTRLKFDRQHLENFERKIGRHNPVSKTSRNLSRRIRDCQLRGRDGYRLRVSDYRIIHIIDDGVPPIVVATIGHRREVYQ